ncbi:MAG: Hsp20 family protein [Candidatus Pacearchaeota archaeon]
MVKELIRIDLPGFEKKDVVVKVKDNKVFVNAEKKHHFKKKGKNFYHEESSYRAVSYMTTIPKGKKVKTEFKKGRLKVVA